MHPLNSLIRSLSHTARYCQGLSVCRSEGSITQALQSAVTCAILAPAGSHRSRMLAMLYKDERVSAPGAVPQFPFLEKMLMERLITPCVS